MNNCYCVENNSTNEGSLIFQSRTRNFDNTILPISGATITIKDKDGNILSVEETDELGKTKEIFLKPSNQYNAEIKYGEYKINLENIKVYEEQPNIVETNLPPQGIRFGAPLRGPIREPIIIDKKFKQHKELDTLMKSDIKSSESNEIHPFNIPMIFTVYDVINKKNLKVPFIDYIANVADNEVGKDWHDNAIKANILAIISYALFKHYIENKDKDYDITSSTADQDYDPEIIASQYNPRVRHMAYDLFSEYLRKPLPNDMQLYEYRQWSCPSTSKYCMLQNKANEMAQKGASLMKILRYFYGEDTFVEKGVALDYPVGDLVEGITTKPRPLVIELQQMLNIISNNYPTINKLEEDGIFGKKTVEAVKNFQYIANLPMTGKVDMSTWIKLLDFSGKLPSPIV
ncbi:peptidoglycan-binding protein [Vallitalea guaymasensis]|uniref:peptidoglycan-binding protein n=1 Tax=Vallitalea guaymasensis TaxID=1185412 RepID=UPI000DE22654|nr:peptidoglycan-binding protein [Vallitalea guaymasensis]